MVLAHGGGQGGNLSENELSDARILEYVEKPEYNYYIFGRYLYR